MEETQACIVCGCDKESGIRIIAHFICTECEAEMIRTDVKDEKYPFFIVQLKQLWYKKDA